MTQRDFDIAVETAAAKRIDSFYAARGVRFERVKDRARQFKGIDIILFGKNRQIKIDEKAKYRGLQEDGAKLKSYSFEVSRLCKDGEYHNGWFIDPDIETDYYCYIFPKLNDSENAMNGLKPNMQMELFSKQDIVDLITKETTLSYIEQVAHLMSVKDTRIVKFKNFVLYKTPAYKLPESPINILISSEVIESTPHFKRFYI